MPLVALRIRQGNAFTVYALEENGLCKLRDFLDAIPNRDLGVLMRLIDYIVNTGTLRNTEQSKQIGDKLFELRTTGGVRVFYFYDAGRLAICTNGYIKKTDKLDPGEVDKAKILRMKYLAAKQD